LFSFGIEEAITGWAGVAIDTDVWIKIVPAGATPDTVTAEFTDTAPTWSDAKQGYYGTVASANHRYVGGLYKDAGSDYIEKWLYTKQMRNGRTRPLLEKIVETGDWNMDAAGETYTHNMTNWKKIRSITVMVRRDDDARYAMLPLVSNAATSGEGMYVDDTIITLLRSGAGFFDNADYNATTYNRGWIIIRFEGYVVASN
ncbi:unnamed protein product, partial [marine sediment metagenome]